MSRYDKYSKKTNDYYEFTLYPLVYPNNIEFITITTTSADRLDLLAKKYFNDSTLWWIIAMVNDIPGDSVVLPSGTDLYIPKQVFKYVH